MRFLFGGFGGAGGPFDRLIGFLFLGLPALMGLRFPWTLNLWSGLVAVPVVMVYSAMLIVSLLRKPRTPGLALLWVMILAFALIFVASSFGADATGRYLLPLVAPIAILIAMQLTASRRRLVAAAITLLLITNLAGNVVALGTVPPGMTPQFDAATDFTNDFDQQVIDFLKAHDGNYGYATYWVTYRLAFLSGETVTLSPQLPYKASLLYADSDRYSAYTTAVANATRPVLITANLPQLDQAIGETLDSHGVTYSRQAIGPYTVFYALSAKVTPGELGLQNLGHAS